jgi:hypothetical protein
LRGLAESGSVPRISEGSLGARDRGARARPRLARGHTGREPSAKALVGMSFASCVIVSAAPSNVEGGARGAPRTSPARSSGWRFRARGTIMIAMLLEGFPARTGRRVAGAMALLAALLVAPLARAETSSSLPLGYASDEQAPAAQGIADGDAAPSADDAPQAADDAPQAAVAPAAPDASAGAEAEYSDTDPSALQDFREPLSSYGTWIDDPTYGTIWVPSSTAVGADFAPYQTAGHWTLDDNDDWLWVSDYEWGYVPFHYGRWVWVPSRGWAWIPGRVYAPAWVVWRTGDYGYIGWAPMPPAYYWSGGVAIAFWTPMPAAYVFCPTTYVFSPRVTTYVVHDRSVVRTAVAHTSPYKPAHPSMGGKSHAAGSAHAAYRPASPSLKAAGVPKSAAPKARGQADRRALAYARPSAQRGPASRPSAQHGTASRGAPGARASAQASWAARHGISRPESRAMVGDVRSRAPSTRIPGGVSDGRSGRAGLDRGRSLPAARPRTLSPSAGLPSRSAPSASRSFPSRSMPSRSFPSRSLPSSSPRPTPSFGGGGWSTPSSRSARPAYRPSVSPRFGGGGAGLPHPSSSTSTRRSAPVRSAPALRGGGARGGFRGGGHRR